MKKLIMSAVIVLSMQYAFAAAPLDRSIREIRNIVSSPELRRFIPSSETILDIRRVDRGYILLTNRYRLFVEIFGLTGTQEGEGEGGSTNMRFNEPEEINR